MARIQTGKPKPIKAMAYTWLAILGIGQVMARIGVPISDLDYLLHVFVAHCTFIEFDADNNAFNNIDFVLLHIFVTLLAEGKSLEDSALWNTFDKTFESWICPLVYSLIGHCSDITLRLCQDIVLLNAEIAELLLPSIMINLAGKKDLSIDFGKLISLKVFCLFADTFLSFMLGSLLSSQALAPSVFVVWLNYDKSLLNLQVEQHIFMETNKMTKSIQVMLDVLNEMRLCHVMVRGGTGSVPNKQENLKASSDLLNLFCPFFWFLGLLRGKVQGRGHLQGPENHLLQRVQLFSLHCGIRSIAMLPRHPPPGRVSRVDSIRVATRRATRLGLGVDSRILEGSEIGNKDPSATTINEGKKTEEQRDKVGGKLTSQILTFEHEGNWSKALEYYDLQVRLDTLDNSPKYLSHESCRASSASLSESEFGLKQRKPYKGVIRSLQKVGCAHTFDLYLRGLASCRGEFQHDLEFVELQYEAAWRSGNWEFSMFNIGDPSIASNQPARSDRFNQNLHSCLRALHEGDYSEYYKELKDSKQILDHLGMTWDLRWRPLHGSMNSCGEDRNVFPEPTIPSMDELSGLDTQWNYIVKQTELHMNLLEPFVAFRKVLLQILGCKDCTVQHLLHSSSVLRKLEEAKLLRAQGRQEMAVNLAKYIAEENQSNQEASDVHRLVGKWLAETRSSNSRTILEKYLKRAVTFADELKAVNKKSLNRKCQTHFHLAHYADALFRSHEERLNSSEWQAALRLRKHKGDKTDYTLKIQELRRQLALDTEVAEKLQDDRDNFLNLALDGYKHCLVLGEKYDVRVVFRLVSIWFGLSSRQNVIKAMISTVDEVQSYKFIPLVYQIASRMGSTKEVQGPLSFQFALASLLKKMAIEHPYHTILQLLALANGDRIKDKQRSRNSYVVDMDKKIAAERLLEELQEHHGNTIRQMKQLVEIYIRLAELETKREDTNKKVNLPRDIRSVRELELVPVLTSNVAVDRNSEYLVGTFPHFKGLGDSIVVMNGINAPKVVECYGSDGKTYKQLAKSGNDDLRQDAVVPFTPSAGIIEWVDGTIPLGEYLIGSSRTGGAHGRYGSGDWLFSKCREHMVNVKDKRKAFQEVCDNFRPVMHFFFLERFLQPADWFEKRLAYTRSVAASSMVGYIVGLGDRHSMNVLIDQATAEVVHIDLGVAFEQGLMLKTPERVPFRLTRDIIDGMGVTGIEGVFRRCCEETLSVMRTNKEALLTIIEVFIHDPLYKWALSPLKALQRQKETEDDLETNWEDSQDEYEGNKDATRALMRVKQKLDGYEDGEMRSVHGQVQQLIQDAIDPERLCHMFPGWGSWM
ncbi:Serine/threonine-protein kinase ATM [Bienertia sinuspersici]